MEIGKIYKVVYKDNNYSKIASGSLLSEDQNLILINDREGKIWIGKQSIVSVKEIE